MVDEPAENLETGIINLDEGTRTIVIQQLNIRDPEVYEFVVEQDAPHRAESLRSALRIGVRGLRAMKSADDVAYVQKEFQALSVRFDTSLQDAKNKIDEGIVSHLNPDQQGSVGAKLKTMVETTSSDLKTLLAETERNLKEEHNKFDPAIEGSYAHRLRQHIDDFFNKVSTMFDPSSAESHIAKFLSQISAYLGDDGKVGHILDEKLSIEQDGAPLATLKKEILTAIQALRDVVSGQEAVLEKSILKGAEFEGIVEAKLCELARPHGDIVEDVSEEKVAGSKAGDFVITLPTGNRLVVEARAREAQTTPKALRVLDTAMRARNAEWGILVSKNPDALARDVGVFNVFENSKIICAYGDGDGDILEVAYKWVRLSALAEQAAEAEVDANLLRQQTEAIRKTIKRFAQIKSHATTIEQEKNSIVTLANDMRKEIEEATAAIEREITAVHEED